MGLTIKTTIQEDRDTFALLERVEIGLRGKFASKARKKAGNIAAARMRDLAPKPGYPGDKPGFKPLNETIRVVDREAKQATFIGPKYPEGAHGHLVELGHEEVLWGIRTGRRVPPYPFARPAVDSTIEQQQQAMAQSIQADVTEALGGR